MALQTSIIPFTGQLGDMIGYRRNGKYYIRSMPKKVRQTKATCKAAKRFGIASKRGALLRKSIYGELDIPRDCNHVTRLTAALIHASPDNLTSIQDFRFNKPTGIDRFFAIAPVFSEDGQLHIPAQVLPKFKGIRYWEVKVIATRIDFKKHCAVDTDIDGTTIDPRLPFNGATLSVSVPGNGALVVVLQVRAFTEHHPSQNKQHMAADIIAVRETKTALQKPLTKKTITSPVTRPQSAAPSRKHTSPGVVKRE